MSELSAARDKPPLVINGDVDDAWRGYEDASNVVVNGEQQAVPETSSVTKSRANDQIDPVSNNKENEQVWPSVICSDDFWTRSDPRISTRCRRLARRQGMVCKVRRILGFVNQKTISMRDRWLAWTRSLCRKLSSRAMRRVARTCEI